MCLCVYTHLVYTHTESHTQNLTRYGKEIHAHKHATCDASTMCKTVTVKAYTVYDTRTHIHILEEHFGCAYDAVCIYIYIYIYIYKQGTPCEFLKCTFVYVRHVRYTHTHTCRYMYTPQNAHRNTHTQTRMQFTTSRTNHKMSPWSQVVAERIRYMYI